jgi:phage-related tail fiber protein
MADYYCIVTDVGLAKLTALTTTGGHLALSQLAVGDGGGEAYDPTAEATALRHEVYRADLHNVVIDPDNPTWVRCEMVLPPQVGGWMIRECGLFDTDGDLIAIGKYPPTYKPMLDDGTTVELVIRMIVEITNAAVVQLLVDTSTVMASQSWVLSIINNFHALPPGGKTGDQLVKLSNTDFDAGWATPRRRVDAYNYFIGQF